MEEETKTVVVIDNGSSTIKAGFAGDDAPRKIFPSVIGYTKKHPINMALDEKSYYVGEEANLMRGRLEMHRPIKDSLIQNWDDMENVWSHTFFNVLKVCPDDVFAVITESPTNPVKYRERTLETLFELYNLEGIYLASKSLLSLYATGRTTGCVVDCGYGSSYTVPIYEGYTSPNTIQELEMGGRHLDDYLNKILFEKGYEFTTPLEMELLAKIKETLCEVKKDSRDESIEPKTYFLPDDSVVRLHYERHWIPEVIFDPSKIDINKPGLHKCCFKSIMKSITDIRPEMFGNIVLAGGNTLFPNFKERLENEIRLQAPLKTEVKIDDAKHRMFSSWIGGSIIGNMDTFQYLCITRKEYEEQGVRIVHNKTF
jgi:actin